MDALSGIQDAQHHVRPQPHHQQQQQQQEQTSLLSSHSGSSRSGSRGEELGYPTTTGRRQVQDEEGVHHHRFPQDRMTSSSSGGYNNNNNIPHSLPHFLGGTHQQHPPDIVGGGASHSSPSPLPSQPGRVTTYSHGGGHQSNNEEESLPPQFSRAFCATQDHGAGMLYNPFDSIAQSLLPRNINNSSGASGLSNEYYNALSGTPSSAAMQRTRSSGDNSLGQQQHTSLEREHSRVSSRSEGDNNHQGQFRQDIQQTRLVDEQRFDHGEVGMHGNFDSDMPADSQGGRSNFISPLGGAPAPGTEAALLAALASASARPSGRYHPHINNTTPSPPQYLPAEESALRAAALAGASCTSDNPSHHQSPHDPQGSILSGESGNNPSRQYNNNSDAVAAALEAASRPRRCHNQNSTINDAHQIQQAISESQAAHIQHTRRQVEADIQFRRAMERASNESAQLMPQDEDPSNPALDGDREVEEQQLLQMVARRSILEEESRQTEDEEKYELDLELALRQSEQLDALKQEEEQRFKESEEEILKDILVKSREEEEKALQQEEELLKHVLAKSVSDNVDEDELVDQVMKKSCEHGNDRIPEEEMLEQVLKMSLEEKEHVVDEEAEQIRKAMEWSTMESYCYDDVNGALHPSRESSGMSESKSPGS